jgi:hypothetical protein
MGSEVLTAVTMSMAVIYRTISRFRSRSGCDNEEKIFLAGNPKERIETESRIIKHTKSSHTENRGPLQLYVPFGTIDLK